MKKLLLKSLLPATLLALLSASSRPVRADGSGPASVNSGSEAGAPAPAALSQDGADVAAKKKHKKKHRKAHAAQPGGGAANAAAAPAADPGR